MAHDVFICHAVEDKTVADAVCATLEGSRITCWIAPRNVLPGVEYAQAIVEAISECRVVVLVFSAHANDSPHVRREVERAVSRGIPILPFRIEDVQPSSTLEYFIGGAHWLDAMALPLEQHLDHLAGTVEQLLARTGAPVPSEEEPEAPAAEPEAPVPEPMDSGPRQPAPPRPALGSAGGWVGRPIVRVALAGGAAVAVVVIIIVLLMLMCDGDNDNGLNLTPVPTDGGAGVDGGKTVTPPTPTEPPPTEEPAELPDLTISAVDVEPVPGTSPSSGRAVLVSGNTYSFRFEVTNVGEVAVGGNVAVSIDYGCESNCMGGPLGQFGDWVVVAGPVQPGASLLSSAAAVTPGATGTYKFIFRVDPDDIYEESDESESSNVWSTTVEVQ